MNQLQGVRVIPVVRIQPIWHLAATVVPQYQITIPSYSGIKCVCCVTEWGTTALVILGQLLCIYPLSDCSFTLLPPFVFQKFFFFFSLRYMICKGSWISSFSLIWESLEVSQLFFRDTSFCVRIFAIFRFLCFNHDSPRILKFFSTYHS